MHAPPAFAVPRVRHLENLQLPAPPPRLRHLPPAPPLSEPPRPAFLLPIPQVTVKSPKQHRPRLCPPSQKATGGVLRPPLCAGWIRTPTLALSLLRTRSGPSFLITPSRPRLLCRLWAPPPLTLPTPLTNRSPAKLARPPPGRIYVTNTTRGDTLGLPPLQFVKAGSITPRATRRPCPGRKAKRGLRAYMAVVRAGCVKCRPINLERCWC